MAGRAIDPHCETCGELQSPQRLIVVYGTERHVLLHRFCPPCRDRWLAREAARVETALRRQDIQRGLIPAKGHARHALPRPPGRPRIAGCCQGCGIDPRTLAGPRGLRRGRCHACYQRWWRAQKESA